MIEMIDSFTLRYGVITTYDFSYASFLKEFGEAQLDRLAIFHGDGLCDDENHVAIKIFFDKKEEDPVAPLFHSKIALFCFENEAGEKRYQLQLGSKNLYRFENIESAVVFEGKKSKRKQKKNGVLQEFLELLASFIAENDPRIGLLKDAISDLPFIDFYPSKTQGNAFLQLLASKASSFSFHWPSKHGLPLFEEDYDELLLIAPFITSDAFETWDKARQATRIIVSNPDTVESLLYLGLEAERYLFLTQDYIHAKCYLARKGNRYDLYVGSMNLTPYSIKKNVELMVRFVDIPLESGLPSFLTSFFGVNEDEVLSSLEDSKGDDLLSYASSYAFRLSYYRFLHKKERFDKDDDLKALSYLLSPRCVSDIHRLLLSIEFPIIPIQKQIETGHKKRTVYHVSFEENLSLGLLNHALHRDDHRFSKNVYLHILGRSPKDVFMKIRGEKSFSSWYLFRSDIHDFDPSMVEGVLLHQIQAFYPDDDIARNFLLNYVKAKRYVKDGVLYDDGPAQWTGLPLGGLLENLYLDDFDKAMEQRSLLYVRCGDDILLGASSLIEAQQIQAEVKTRLEKKKLTLSQKKTSIVAPNEPFPFLGYRVQGQEIDLDDQYLQNLLKTIRKKKKSLLRLYERKKVIPLLRLPSLLAYLKKDLEQFNLKAFFQSITTAKSLKIIDDALLDLIREVSSGSKGKEKYRIGSKQLHLFGWRSLVNAYYRHIGRHINEAPPK